ncbi:hypothetical protein TNCT_341231 [Trichonephila clavata]|uniref:Uncharacterized protein n=1 Tax=Trichonephila clavata TaxID=2740835 RepID=A0A8X6FRB0_TRICU|nr:hypothetical protein TNCT_341231 [Trichonephila clavata]
MKIQHPEEVARKECKSQSRRSSPRKKQLSRTRCEETGENDFVDETNQLMELLIVVAEYQLFIIARKRIVAQISCHKRRKFQMMDEFTRFTNSVLEKQIDLSIILKRSATSTNLKLNENCLEGDVLYLLEDSETSTRLQYCIHQNVLKT